MILHRNIQVLAYSLLGLLTWMNLLYLWVLIAAVQFFNLSFSFIHFLLGPHYVIIRLLLYAVLAFFIIKHWIIDKPIWPKRVFTVLIVFEITLFVIAFIGLMRLWIAASLVAFDYQVVYGILFFRLIHVAATLGYGIYFNYVKRDNV